MPVYYHDGMIKETEDSDRPPSRKEQTGTTLSVQTVSTISKIDCFSEYPGGTVEELQSLRVTQVYEYANSVFNQLFHVTLFIA